MVSRVKMAIFSRMEQRLREAQRARECADRQRAEQDAEVQKLIPRLLKLSAGPVGPGPGPGRAFRVCVDLDERLVHEAFVHGDSRYQLEYVGRQVGIMVQRELATLNFSRYREEEPRLRGFGRYDAMARPE